MRSWLAPSLFLAAAACSSSEAAPQTGNPTDAGTETSASPPSDGSGAADSPHASDAPEGDGLPLGQDAGGPVVGGCSLFPSAYPYNQDVSQSPLDPGSATYIANLKTRAGAIVAEYPGGEYLNVVP